MANFLKYLHQNLAHAQFPDFCETYFIRFNFSIEENENKSIQYSPFSSTQWAKESFKLVEHSQASLLINVCSVYYMGQKFALTPHFMNSGISIW